MDRTHYQCKTAKAIAEHFQSNRRGKIVWPCGTGKTRLSIMAAQQLDPTSVLICMPSLGLVRQTLRAWQEHYDKDAPYMCVCSAQELKDHQKKDGDVGVAVTTDASELKKFMAKRGKKVVLTTYMSGKVVIEGSKRFDFGIYDEAHNTAGSGNVVPLLLFDENIRVNKRLFMTATERFYKGKKDNIVSMCDEKMYGTTIDSMQFSDAIEYGWLSDYKICVLEITREEVKEYIKENLIVSTGSFAEDAELVASAIALRKVMEQKKARHALTFHSTVSRARRFAKINVDMNGAFGVSHVTSVDGGMPMKVRQEKIDKAISCKRSIITNARCMGEGIDVPEIDVVLFADPKNSTVDIVQSACRAMRYHPKKKMAYLVIPVLVDEHDNSSDERFKASIDTIRRMGSADGRIVAQISDAVRDGGGKTESDDVVQFLCGERTLHLRDFSESIRVKYWNRVNGACWFYTYEELQAACREASVTSKPAYEVWYKTDPMTPSSPSTLYPEWVSWPAFFGRSVGRYTYKELQAACSANGINSQSAYVAWSRTDPMAPSSPHTFYHEWVSWPHLFGRIGREGKYTYKELQLACIANGINYQRAYREWRKTDPMAPSRPHKFYHEWVSWPHFFGRFGREGKYTYKELQAACSAKGIDSQSAYRLWYKADPRAPSSPHDVYHEWVSWPHLFGRIGREGKYTYKELQSACSKNGINSSVAYKLWYKTNLRAPSSPHKFYPEWVSWPHFFGKK